MDIIDYIQAKFDKLIINFNDIYTLIRIMGNHTSKQFTDEDYHSGTYKSDFFQYLMTMQVPATPISESLIDDGQNTSNFIFLTIGRSKDLVTYQTLNFSVCMIPETTQIFDIFTYKKITYKDFPIIVVQINPIMYNHICYFLKKCKIFVSIKEFVIRLNNLSNFKDEYIGLNLFLNNSKEFELKLPDMEIADPTKKPDSQYLFESSARESFMSYQRTLSQSSFSNVMESSAVMESEASQIIDNSFVSQSSEVPVSKPKPKKKKKSITKRSISSSKPSPPPTPQIKEESSGIFIKEQSTEIFSDVPLELSSISITDSTTVQKSSKSSGLSSQFQRNPKKSNNSLESEQDILSSSSMSSEFQSSPKTKKSSNSSKGQSNHSSVESSLASTKSARRKNQKNNRSPIEIIQARNISTIPPAPTLSVKKMNTPPRRKIKRPKKKTVIA